MGDSANGGRKRCSMNAKGHAYVNQSGKRGGSYAKEELSDNVYKGLFSMGVSRRRRGESLIALPEQLTAELAAIESSLHVIAAGCAVGVMKGQTLVPDADLARSLMLRPDAFPSVEVDRHTALSFLHRDAFVLEDAPKGYILIRYKGLALGFVKNLGNRCNNLHPQSRRIRMNI